jgi:hypothetical protein
MLFLALAFQLGQVDFRWGRIRSSLDVWYSRSLALAAQNFPDTEVRRRASSQAIQAAVQATEISDDRHNAYYNLALLRAEGGDMVEAEHALYAAIKCAPRWFKPHWLLSEILRLSGRLGSAKLEAQIATELNGGKNPEVAEELRRIQTETQPR